MKKTAVPLAMLLLLLSLAHSAGAALIKAYVAGFSVAGAGDRAEMASGLQGLLKSRLSDEAIFAVDSQAGADITVTGNYLQFGKIFSIDAVARSSDGKLVARSFVQGESREELIPAMDRLGKLLADELRKAAPQPSSAQKP